MRRACRAVGHAFAGAAGGIVARERAGEDGTDRASDPAVTRRTAVGDVRIRTSSLRVSRSPAGRLVLDDLTSDVQQPAVLHTGRTGRFARAAGQTAIEVLSRVRRPGRPRPSA